MLVIKEGKKKKAELGGISWKATLMRKPGSLVKEWGEEGSSSERERRYRRVS